jgi:hypothetical protein
LWIWAHFETINYVAWNHISLSFQWYIRTWDNLFYMYTAIYSADFLLVPTDWRKTDKNCKS